MKTHLMFKLLFKQVLTIGFDLARTSLVNERSKIRKWKPASRWFEEMLKEQALEELDNNNALDR